MTWKSTRSSTQNTYPFPTNGSKSRKFVFSIQSENEWCGRSEPAFLTVIRTFPPSPMECPKVSQLRCSARISWTAPEDDGGAPVSDYKVEIMKADGSWYHLTQCN
jgi:hypothetical protein